ncbi:MAG: complex I subunit 1 family protein [Candidatus Omnitrophota bacterium]
MNLIAQYLFFPGLLFSLLVGGLGWWLERKLTARFQYRVGPPWYQTYIDILKLFFKETILPQDANKTLFVLSPLLAFSSAVVVGIIINKNYFSQDGFLGDIFVILYLLIIPSLFIIIGGLSSSNPLASVGAAREIKLMLSYEFVFIVSVVIIIIKSGGSFSLEGIIKSQAAGGSHIASLSGAIGFILAFLYLQAKLGIVPFDVAEAEQEIMGGTFIEYSGSLLGFYRLAKTILYCSLPILLIALFMGNKTEGIHLIYKYCIIILLVSVVKNTNPRLRIKDVIGLFWFFLFPLGCLGVVLAVLGK